MKAKIEATPGKDHDLQPEVGDVFWVGHGDRELVIVARVSASELQLISLSDGNRWDEPCSLILDIEQQLQKKNATPANIKIVNA